MSAWLRNRTTLELATLAHACVWLLCVIAWRSIESFPALVGWLIFGATIPMGCWWLWGARKDRHRPAFWIVASVVYIVWWQFAVFGLDAIYWDAARATVANVGRAGLFFVGLLWLVYILERGSEHYRLQREDEDGNSATPETSWNPLDLEAWYYTAKYSPLDLRFFIHVFSLPWSRRKQRPTYKPDQHLSADSATDAAPGSRNRKLDQSVLGLLTYVMVFVLVSTLFSQIRGCREIYESPAGGGEQKTLAQVVRVQKVIRKKFVVNPYSAIVFEVPPIDEVKLQLNEVTEHAYTVGYGEGAGAGFAGGTQRGKVRFIRLEYSGGDWDQDFGIGGDLNMLVEYGIRTQHKIADKTESRLVSQLRNFPIGKSPPIVYMTGQKNISLSSNDIKTLREYVTDKHGMVFCDNGGSRHFHNQFLATMNRVLPDVRPVPIPLDDVIHRVPFQIPFLPYVAPHGGKEALGWYKDGRWLAYYHPGDIGDAWSDGHAGVDPEVWEACYQLGTNVVFYAHAEYAKWAEAQNKGK